MGKTKARKPRHLAAVPDSGEKPEMAPPPKTITLPPKAAELVKGLYLSAQQAQKLANAEQRKLIESVRLVTAAMGIDPDSKDEKWNLDPMTGVLTKVK